MREREEYLEKKRNEEQEAMEEEDRAREKYLKSKTSGSEAADSDLSQIQNVDVSSPEQQSVVNKDEDNYDDEF